MSSFLLGCQLPGWDSSMLNLELVWFLLLRICDGSFNKNHEY
jgi:hypothetical protein